MNENPLVPGKALRGVAGGLLLMAAFTFFWLRLASLGLPAIYGSVLLTIGFLFGLLLLGFAIYLYKIAAAFPKVTSEEDKAEEKRTGKWFGIIFGGEGVAIFPTCTVLSSLRLQQYVIPAIALIVGLHFYPMAWVFKRKLDYYTATWTSLVALAGIWLTFRQGSQESVVVLVGLGTALATITYGLNMMREGYKLSRKN
ncbi:hypothetical protein FHW36_102641 [Chitinophaga polysaccharea]|uniref:Uncharacterized protein n=1 Tax=Chitinophaga polysaccharea TaxID=1293035 RepID=A0A561PXN7_9BACT|nr:hypothetical protein [Chitinophaga polysaccharea]TWF42880.1 hypothetical protein FHW36_102641 [Chitinophaga polysaccharea]